MASFVHLRVKSAYSLLEGGVRPKEVAMLAVERGIAAVAGTAHNHLLCALASVRAVPQMVGRHAHVGAERLPHQGVRVVPELGREQRFHRRPHAIDDRLEIPRLATRRLLQPLARGQDRPALRMPQPPHTLRPAAPA